MRATRNEADHFPDTIDCWVREKIQSGVSAFDDLLRGLPGVYPVDVVSSLQRLARDGRVPRERAETLLAGSNSLEPSVMAHQSLPVPHPLDFDWRFTPMTIARLLRDCSDLTHPGDTVACFGTPSVFEAALREMQPELTVLLDANDAMVRHFLSKCCWLRVCNCNLMFDSIPQIHASIVVCDPPWYFESITAFLWAASQTCVVGGHVMTSLPPTGTRPGIVEETGAILDMAGIMGLRLVKRHESALRYESPPFERNALRAAGIRLAGYNWRAGDLYVFHRSGANRHPRPLGHQVTDRWLDETLSGVRIRIRQRGVALADPRLIPLVPGDILPSVSTRHPLRETVDVWTSGNRVFGCAGTTTLHEIILSVGYGQDPIARVTSASGGSLSNQQRAWVTEAASQVNSLLAQERSDFLSAGYG